MIDHGFSFSLQKPSFWQKVWTFYFPDTVTVCHDVKDGTFHLSSVRFDSQSSMRRTRRRLAESSTPESIERANWGMTSLFTSERGFRVQDTHLLDCPVTYLTVSNKSFITHTRPLGGQQSTGGLNTERCIWAAGSSSCCWVWQFTHQVVTAAVCGYTLIDSFTVLPISFVAGFTHAVALSVSQAAEYEDETMHFSVSMWSDTLICIISHMTSHMTSCIWDPHHHTNNRIMCPSQTIRAQDFPLTASKALWEM